MINMYWRAGLLCVGIGLLTEAAWAQNPTVYYRPIGAAVSRECIGGPADGQACTSAADCEFGPDCQRFCFGGENEGMPCPENDCGEGLCPQRACFCNYVISPSVGFVFAEVYVRDWVGSIGGYQVTADFTEFIDRVHPIGWECISSQTETPISCSSDNDCSGFPEFPECWFDPVTGSGTFCACANHRPEEGVFIDTGRTDWLFAGKSAFVTSDVSSPTFLFAAAEVGAGQADPGTPRYLATMSLSLENTACGEIHIPIVRPPDTLLTDGVGLPLDPIDLESITLRLPTCVCRRILDRMSDPANCSIDPAQPSEPDGAAVAGWDRIALQLDCPDTNAVLLNQFRVRTDPATTTGPPDTISRKDPEESWVSLGLNEPVEPGFWTCFQYDPPTTDPTTEVCVGFLPGDVDLSQTSNGADVAELRSCLRRPAAERCEQRLCDVDRSGLCAPADLLREVDLLAGAEMYSPGWDGVSLGACPTAAP